MRSFAAIGMFLLAVGLAMATVLAIMLQNFTGAPEPDGEAVAHPVSSGGTVQLSATKSYELGVYPDLDDPNYRGGTALASPDCVVRDPAGVPVEIHDMNPAPRLNPFTRYGRFVSSTAGEYHVACHDVVPAASDLVVVDDVWQTHRATEAQRRQRQAVTGLVGGLCSMTAMGLAIRLTRRRFQLRSGK